MTDRARLVYALLRTLFAWAPTPRSRMGLDRVPRGFAGGTLRTITCPDCLTNDHLHRGLSGCETCGGRGVIADPGPDPYETKASTRFLGVAGERQADQRRRRDMELARLERQLDRPARREDEEADDPLLDAFDLHRRMSRHGSYAELEAALERLRLRNPGAYEVAMFVAYQPFGAEPVDPVRRVVVRVCELLAVMIDGPVRVPAFVPVSEDAETERIARDGKGALWRGHSSWASLKRGERNALIVGMAAEGRSTRAIGMRFNLSRQHVRKILAAHELRQQQGTASGPAA